MERFAVIMAGGSGTRLWPLSRDLRPKQFIRIGNGECMLVQTAERLCKIIPGDNCFIITNINLLDITRDTVRGLIPSSNIIVEPSRKNTSACIAYAALLLKMKYGDGLLCFVPADGYIRDHENYKTAIENACQAAEATDGIVIVGVTPSYPATGYGYIRIDPGAESAVKGVLKVKEFIEKPDAKTAEKYAASGEYLWNCGIVAGRTDVIINSVKAYLPRHYEKLTEVLKYENSEYFAVRLGDAYNALESVSFDYGVLEKSNSIYAVKGIFDWDDIGSLDALAKFLDTDKSGNAVKGRHFGIDTINSVIYSEGITVATIDVHDMIIAATKDAVLICPHNRSQDVRAIVEMLRQSGVEDLV